MGGGLLRLLFARFNRDECPTLGPQKSACRFKDELYGCASLEFLNWFAASPAAYLAAVQKRALACPASIHLLELQVRLL